jgi:CheY-like chemotaxis protein
MTSAMLSRLGWEVVQAADGFEALQLLQTKADSIQCVLTDLTMPNMTGWEVISRIRAIRPNIPVILLSGYDEIQVMKEDHPVKPQAFLKKPYRIPDLRDTLLQVLAASSD